MLLNSHNEQFEDIALGSVKFSGTFSGAPFRPAILSVSYSDKCTFVNTCLGFPGQHARSGKTASFNSSHSHRSLTQSAHSDVELIRDHINTSVWLYVLK